ncbi:MAG: DUF2480 family protein [Phycisphaerales bacterium]|nr:DUF2480 family protein [Phycisphaerales bacterium]
MQQPEIVNRVANSELITIDLARFYSDIEVVPWDIKAFLFMELVLREKDYRLAVQQQNWHAFQDKYVAMFCSTDAIVPTWAYMLALTYLQGVASRVIWGTVATATEQLVLEKIQAMNTEEYKDKRIVVKGCGELAIPTSLFIGLTEKLLPVCKSLSYGEPCSTVPIFKRKS